MITVSRRLSIPASGKSGKKYDKGTNRGLVLGHHEEAVLDALGAMQSRGSPGNGKWSGPRAGALLTCTVPVSMASLIAMAASMSRVNTHPCRGSRALSAHSWN